jgi:c-di-GMP-binding flagellar brake protein YcgR
MAEHRPTLPLDPERDEHVTDAATVAQLLHDAARARATCSIRVPTRADQHLARILSFDEETATLAFEPPRAPYLARALSPGMDARVDIKDGERRGTFRTKVVGVLDSGGVRALVLERPREMVRHRRRDAFRLAVPPSMGVRLDIDRQEPRWCGLQVENLGPDGAMVSLVGPLERFEPASTFPDAVLSLPDGDAFEVALRVRHSAVMRVVSPTEGELRVGVKFLQPPAGFDKAVTRLIETIAKSTTKR